MSGRGPARVLVVDDELPVLETIAAILRREGYDVAAAASVEEALAHLGRSDFDVALTDLRMEDANGLSLLAEIRGKWPDTVAVVLTGYASLQSAIDALREGVYDYLIKPCEVEELKATIARAVERGALAQALRQRLRELDEANAKLQSFNEELQDRVERATAALSQKVSELDVARQRLEAEQRQRTEFMSMIAHELSQPLTLMNGYAQMLGRPNAPDTLREKARLSIISQTQRMVRLVRDLSDAAHLQSGSFQVARELCDLAVLVREQVDQARGGEPGAQISYDGPVEGIAVDCDRDRVVQVLSNLLSNAKKYAPGSPVEVRLSRAGHKAVLAVRDRGPGIPPDRLATIFQPYVRLRSQTRPDEPRGSGLGLYIARGIVEAHGGSIRAESRGPGKGTTFTVELPEAVRAEC